MHVKETLFGEDQRYTPMDEQVEFVQEILYSIDIVPIVSTFYTTVNDPCTLLLSLANVLCCTQTSHARTIFRLFSLMD